MKIIFSHRCLEYFQHGHPESPERVRSTYEFLKEKGFEFLSPEPAKEKDILKTHSKEFYELVKSGGFYDSDTPAYENIFYYTSLSAGGAIRAMETCFQEYSLSLMRPPGHHAGRGIKGFCYFNNIAIAVMKALDEKKIKKAAIIDIDVHHGNGTQELFLGDKRVIYFSLHQSPLYPGTGLRAEENCLNYPLPAGIKEPEYLEKLEEGLMKVREFDPNLIAISAGFDTYKLDSLASLRLEISTYKKIGKLIKNLGKPTFSVLEGGYSSRLSECVYSYLRGFE